MLVSFPVAHRLVWVDFRCFTALKRLSLSFIKILLQSFYVSIYFLRQLNDWVPSLIEFFYLDTNALFWSTTDQVAALSLIVYSHILTQTYTYSHLKTHKHAHTQAWTPEPDVHVCTVIISITRLCATIGPTILPLRMRQHSTLYVTRPIYLRIIFAYKWEGTAEEIPKFTFKCRPNTHIHVA